MINWLATYYIYFCCKQLSKRKNLPITDYIVSYL